jgi:hypothetical protein
MCRRLPPTWKSVTLSRCCGSRPRLRLGDTPGEVHPLVGLAPDGTAITMQYIAALGRAVTPMAMAEAGRPSAVCSSRSTVTTQDGMLQAPPGRGCRQPAPGPPSLRRPQALTPPTPGGTFCARPCAQPAPRPVSSGTWGYGGCSASRSGTPTKLCCATPASALRTWPRTQAWSTRLTVPERALSCAPWMNTCRPWRASGWSRLSPSARGPPQLRQNWSRKSYGLHKRPSRPSTTPSRPSGRPTVT